MVITLYNCNSMPYLIFVASISSSTSVKSFDWGEFFHNAKGAPDRHILGDVVLSSVSFYTQCVILHTVCNFTRSV